MNRRDLLKATAGAVVGGRRMAAAIEQQGLGMLGGAAASGPMVSEAVILKPPIGYNLIRYLQRRKDIKQEATHYYTSKLYPEISNKRSWSESYKIHQIEKEVIEFREIMDKIHEDEEFVRKLSRVLGIEL